MCFIKSVKYRSSSKISYAISTHQLQPSLTKETLLSFWDEVGYLHETFALEKVSESDGLLKQSRWKKSHWSGSFWETEKKETQTMAAKIVMGVIVFIIIVIIIIFRLKHLQTHAWFFFSIHTSVFGVWRWVG